MNKSLIIASLILESFVSFGQKKEEKKDTISVLTNAIQLERLNSIQEKINGSQKEFSDLLELIFGVKIEEVDWWGFKQGKFQFILKPKKK